MRRPRLIPEPGDRGTHFHCINRVVGGEWLLDEECKELLRKQMWLLAQYCGLLLVTYALMSNHTHMLLHVPAPEVVSDAELLRRYRLLYSRLKPHQERALEAVEKDMAVNGELAQRWRARQMRQMFDVSVFNKLLKMRFTIWYNKTHKRIGTFWAERFKSVVVEDGAALQEIAAYIDLNAVRAGMVRDPKDYRFCGYAEAVAGMDDACRGIQSLYNEAWPLASEYHRAQLLGRMSDIREGDKRMPEERWRKETGHSGRLPLPVQWGCRVRHFVDGGVIGSAAFVRKIAQGIFGERKREPRPLVMKHGGGSLYVMDRLLCASDVELKA